MESVSLIIVSVLNIACFLIGLQIGMKVKGNDTKIIDLPKPSEVIKNYKESKEEKIRREELNENMNLINNFDGTNSNS